MQLAQQVKPLSYLKSNAAEIIRALGAGAPPLVITQNGEAKAVLQDLASFEQTQETLALLKILALGQAQIASGAFSPASEVFKRIRTSLAVKAV